MIKSGDILTIEHDIISISGSLLFKKGDKVTIDEVVIKPGYWGKRSDKWIEPALEGIKLYDQSGIWNLSTFLETSDKFIKPDEVFYCVDTFTDPFEELPQGVTLNDKYRILSISIIGGFYSFLKIQSLVNPSVIISVPKLAFQLFFRHESIVRSNILSELCK